MLSGPVLALDLGATNADVLAVSETIAGLGRIGGSSAEQMANGMLQFTQALRQQR